MSVVVSVIIPIYNALPQAKQCLASLYEHGADLNFEVVLVDNGSTPDVEVWARALADEHSNLQYHRYPDPLGFACAVNTGVAASKGDSLIILNSDTLVTSRWMDELHAALLSDPSLGALTPTTNQSGEPAQMDFGTFDLTATKALALAAKKKKQPSILYLPQRVTFFCVALRRDVWLEFNGLDEAYGVGNFEDDDLCLRLRVAGYRLGVAQHVFVYHHSNATFSVNKISHSGWMSKNAATFAARARSLAEADPITIQRHWPKAIAADISMVILPSKSGPLERTLRSLQNQTVCDFELIEPGEPSAPTRAWIAYVRQGDILYPFHLESLVDAMERSSQEAIFADGWVRDALSAESHPDAITHMGKAPRMLAGWMHHSSLHPDRIYEETTPLHWPRLTWETEETPTNDAVQRNPRLRWSAVNTARNAYRSLLPLETRYRIDAAVRKLINRPLIDPKVKHLQLLTAHLHALLTTGVDAGRFQVDGTLPAVIQFNAVAWNLISQRQHHFARGLAELGHTVFWVEPLLSPTRNWWTGRPLPLGAPNVHLLRLPSTGRNVYRLQWSEETIAAMMAAVQQTMAAYGVREAVILVNYPRFQPLVKRLREQFHWKIVSDVLDDQRALAGMYQATLSTFEDWLDEHADAVVTSSVVLQKRLEDRDSTVIHNATNYELFSSATSMGYLAELGRPIIGFFGALANWLDMELISAAAKRFPDWTFVFIGPSIFSHTPVHAVWLRAIEHSNIMVLPSMDLRKLAAHLADFDVCTMPFQDIPVTRSMNPVKVYEYLSSGKPVICRDLPEMRALVQNAGPDLVDLYQTQEEYFTLLLQAVQENDPALRDRRRAFARANDWSSRVAMLSGVICGQIVEQPKPVR